MPCRFRNARKAEENLSISEIAIAIKRQKYATVIKEIKKQVSRASYNNMKCSEYTLKF